MKRAPILIALILLSACSEHKRIKPRGERSAAAGAASDRPLSEEWLTGNWAPEGESCTGDNIVHYNQGGDWAAYGANGHWQVQGNTIVATIDAQGGDNDTLVELPAPERNVETIRITSEDSFESRWQDGTTHSLTRCR